MTSSIQIGAVRISMAVYARPIACLAGAEQLRRAMAGDVDAQMMLMRAGAQRGLTDRDRRTLRNEAIARIGRWLLEGAPERSRNWVAAVLADAGRGVAAGHRHLHGELLSELTRAETTELADRLRKVLSWAPPTRGGRVWLDQRQLDCILRHHL